jgi:hypothetical protein
VVQHENRADAGEDRPQQQVRAGEIQRSQSGTNDVVAELLHLEVTGRLGYEVEACWKALKKQLVRAEIGY